MITMVTTNTTNSEITPTTTAADVATTSQVDRIIPTPITDSDPSQAIVVEEPLKVAPSSMEASSKKPEVSNHTVELLSDSSAASSADGSIDQSLSDSHQPSQDLWLRAVAQQPQDTTTDGDAFTDAESEEEELHTPTISATAQEENPDCESPSRPISEDEDEATSMHSHDDLDFLEPVGTTFPKAVNTLIQPSPDVVLHKKRLETTEQTPDSSSSISPHVDPSPPSNSAISSDSLYPPPQSRTAIVPDEDSTIVHSDRGSFTNKPAVEGRYSSVTFTTETAGTSSEFLLTPENRGIENNNNQKESHVVESVRMTASERWRDDTKVLDQGLSSVPHPKRNSASSEFLVTPQNRGIDPNQKDDVEEALRMTASERWRDDTKVEQSLPPVASHHDASSEFFLTPHNRGIDPNQNHNIAEAVRMTESERWRDTKGEQGVPSVAAHSTSSEFLIVPEKETANINTTDVVDTSARSTKSKDDLSTSKTIIDTSARSAKSKDDSLASKSIIDSSSRTTKSKDDVSVSDRMSASERWRDDTKVQGLPKISRKVSVMTKGDFGPPMIPKRTSYNSNDPSMVSSSTNPPPQPKKSILKANVDEELFIKSSRRCWKKLPPPNMDKIKMTRLQMLEFLLQQEEQAKLEGEDDGVPGLPTKSGMRHSQSEGANVQAPLKTLRERSNSEMDLMGKRNVVFQKICIREHQQTIGDNPSVSYGTPISLDWPYMDVEPLDLDDYENSKQRRTMRQMFLNHYQRKNILIHKYGHSVAEVKAAKYATNKVRNQRNVSKMMQTSFQPLLVFEEMRESAVRKAKRRISNGSSNKREEGSSAGSVISSGEFRFE